MKANPQQGGLVRLIGTISSYKVARTQASFVFDDRDHSAIGVVAIAAGLAGLGGQAIATASYATSTKEDADFVQFRLNDVTVEGWLWRSPFKDGDEVELVGEWKGFHFEVAAVARPMDRVVALYPHCSRGTRRHVINAAKWWLFGCTAFVAALLLLNLAMSTQVGVQETLQEGGWYFIGAVYAFFGLMTASLARKWMPFARLSQKVFEALRWPNPSGVDLVKSSKQRKNPNDPGEFGTFYFRY